MERTIEPCAGLGRHVADETDVLASAFTAEADTRLRARLHELRRPRSRVGWRVLGWGALAAGMAGALIPAWLLTRPLGVTIAGRRVRGSEEWVATSASSSTSFAFTDGSRVTVGAQSRARILAVARTGARVLLEQGHADVSVTPRSGSTWSFVAGPFAVKVTGTKFTLDWNSQNQELVVTMREGHVVVAGCALGEGRDVFVGETLRASCRDAVSMAEPELRGSSAHVDVGSAVHVPSGPIPSPVNAKDDVEDPRVVTTPARVRDLRSRGASRATRGVPTWRQLLHGGAYREALALAERGGFAAACAAASPGDLMALGDGARLIGDVARAEQAYRILRARFPHHSQAPLAAFSLGRLAFERQSDYRAAADWFRVYLSESPAGDLTREASGRWMESLYRAGDVVHAQVAAETYAARYPSGPYAKLARGILAK